MVTTNVKYMYIADSTGGEQVPGNDAITNFLRPLIYLTLLEKPQQIGGLR